LRVFNLVNGVLQLPVQDLPVGNHYNAIKYLPVRSIMKARQPVGEPRNTVSLPAPGRMLDQIISPGAFASRQRHELAHRVQSVIPGENHRLPRHPPMSATTIAHLLLFFLEEHEMTENIEEALEL